MNDLDYGPAERLLRRVSIEGIRAHPLEFALYTPKLAWRELTAEPSGPAWAEIPAANERLESRPLLGVTTASLGWRFAMEAGVRGGWPVLCWLAVGGLVAGLFTPHRYLVLALALVPAGYLLATASLDKFTPRHSVPMIPFVVALTLALPASLLFLSRGRSARRAGS